MFSVCRSRPFLTSCIHSLLWLSAFQLISTSSTIEYPSSADKSLVERTRQGGKSAVLRVEQSESHWFTNVTIQGQIFSLMIDTGSTVLSAVNPSLSIRRTGKANMICRWVPGSNFSGPNNQTTYALNGGAAANIVSNITFCEYYLGAQASGKVIRNAVSLSRSGAVVEDFDFGVATTISAAWPFGGILGMGFPRRNCKCLVFLWKRIWTYNLVDPSLGSQPTLFQSLMPRLESPIFAVDFKVQAAESRKNPTMEFGRVDDRKYTGRLAKVAIDPTVGFWTAKNVSFNFEDIHSNESTDPIFGAYVPIFYFEFFLSR